MNYGAGPAHSTNRLKGRAAATDTASHELFPAPGVGFKNWVSLLSISNTSATDTQVQIKSGTTIIWTVPCPSHGGAIIPFPDPIDGNENEAINFTVDDASTTVTVSAAGYKATV